MRFATGQFLWNAVDLSAHVREIRLTIRKQKIADHDTMGSTGVKYVMALDDYDLEITFRQDFAAGAVDVTLAADQAAGTARAWRVRADVGTISSTNPEYQGTGAIEEYAPVHGAFNDILGTRATIVPTVAGVVRDTTP